MIIDLQALESGRVYDACVIGSGPAGTTLAHALYQKGKSVIVLEGGALQLTKESQALYRGETVGVPYYSLDTARLRFFGGSSNHWGGWCRPLDAIDFELLEKFPDTEWPISKSDLDPFADAAKNILDLDGHFADRELSNGLQEVEFLWSTPPVKFGSKYMDDFENATRLTLCINANLTDLATDGERIISATVKNFEGKIADVRAKTFILACGGIENSRLLLHLNDKSAGRLIKNDTTLGRYWMEHPHFRVGEAVMSFPNRDTAIYVVRRMRFFSLTPMKQRSLGVLNCGLRVTSMPGHSKRLRELQTSLACQVPKLGEWIWQQFDRDLTCSTEIHAAWEQEPLARNRVVLSASQRDAFGMPAPILHLERSEEDRRTAEQTVIAFGEFLARNRLGRAKLASWLRDREAYPTDWLLGGYHHMGGTRMGRSPQEGIVDNNLKVWGQDNFYIAGSSVFCSGGHANPTFTICQLSLRLAEHLQSKV